MKSEPNWNFICIVIVSLGVISTFILQIDTLVENWWVMLVIVPIFIFAMIILGRLYTASSDVEQMRSKNAKLRTYTDEQCRAINERLMASDDGLRCVLVEQKSEEQEEIETLGKDPNYIDDDEEEEIETLGKE